MVRAVYSDADIYLLDDPLSAVDSHVGKHIFENVIGPNGILGTKTRLLVTHGITYLSNVDNIYVISNGEISESGNLRKLINSKGAFADFLIQHLQEDVNAEEENLDEIKQQLKSTLEPVADTEFVGKLERAISRSQSESHSETAQSLNGSLNELPAQNFVSRENGIRKRSFKKEDSNSDIKAPAIENKMDKLIEQEKSEVGSVKWDVYKHYLKSIGVKLILLTIFLNLMDKGFSIGSNVWLSKWSTDTSVVNDTSVQNMYLVGYAAFGLGQGWYQYMSHRFIRETIIYFFTIFLFSIY